MRGKPASSAWKARLIDFGTKARKAFSLEEGQEPFSLAGPCLEPGRKATLFGRRKDSLCRTRQDHASPLSLVGGRTERTLQTKGGRLATLNARSPIYYSMPMVCVPARMERVGIARQGPPFRGPCWLAVVYWIGG